MSEPTPRDWYDKLVSAAGLDAHRTDRILGTPDVDSDEFPAPAGYRHQALKVSLFARPSGPRYLVLEPRPPANDRSFGLIPLTPANVARLRTILASVESHRHAIAPGPDTSSHRVPWWRRWRIWLEGERLEDFGVLPDPSPHMRTRVTLRRQRRDGLQLTLRCSSSHRSVLFAVLATPECCAALAGLLNRTDPTGPTVRDA